MVTFLQAHGRITDQTLGGWVDIIAPSAGQSASLLACRLKWLVATPGSVQDHIMLTLALGDSNGPIHEFEEIPIPIAQEVSMADLMGYFSPLIQYGLSHPHRIMMSVDTPLQIGDELWTYGYATAANEA